MDFARWLIAVSLAGLAGCAEIPNDAQRAASIEPYHNWNISGQPIATYIGDRTALLIISNDFEPGSGESGDIIRWHLEPHQTQLLMSRGLAVPIDRRGYFLTACHCVETTWKLTVAYPDNGSARIAAARVVAKLPALDVAILAIDAPLSEIFEWSPSVPVDAGETLLVGGAKDLRADSDGFTFDRQILGGKLTSSSAESGGWSIKHNAPMHQGDSGGPTLNAKGQLVGINSRMVYFPLFEPIQISYRPDPAEVTRLIEADVVNHRAKSE